MGTSESSSYSEVFQQRVTTGTEIEFAESYAMMQQEVKSLNKKKRQVYNKMDYLTEDDVSNENITLVESDLLNIREEVFKYQDAVQDFMENYRDILEQSGVTNQWQSDLRVVVQDSKSHALQIRSRKESLCPTPRMTQMEKESLEVQKSILQIQQLSLEESKKANSTRIQTFEEDNTVMAETEQKIISW